MVPRDPPSDGDIIRDVNRRTVLQGIGTGAVAGVGLVGTATGHRVEGKPVFCGCSQLCVCVEGNAGVLMAQETDDDGYEIGFLRDGELVPYPDGVSPYGGNFCVSTDDEDVPDGKIIGLQVAGTRWVNPNQCAQDALDAEQEQLDSTHPRPEGDSGGPCGKPPCEHPGRGSGNGRGGGGAGQVTVTWEDCETVSVRGSEEGLDQIIVHYVLCYPGDGPCPEEIPGGKTIDDPELPLTIEDQYLTEDVPYYIPRIELRGDVEQDLFEKPDDLECSFEQPTTIDSCTNITESGAYELVNDLRPEEGEACLKILVEDVTIDGNGHTIDGSALSDSTDSTGILIDTSDDSESGGGVKIRDLRIRNWTDGVSLIESESLVIEETDIRDNDHAIDVEDGNDLDLRSVLIEDNGEVADGFWAFGDVRILTSDIRGNGNGLVVFDGALEIESSMIEDNGGAGVVFSDMGGVTIADTTVRGNAGEGIGYRFAPPDLRNVTLAGNEGLELDQGPESDLTASNLTIGDSPTLEVAGISDPVSLDDVDSDGLPELPDSATAVGDGLDVTIDEGTFDARFAFDTEDADRVELWRYDGTAWELVEDATVDDGSIQATLSRDGIYAPVLVAE